jgi:hypothetical protein
VKDTGSPTGTGAGLTREILDPGRPELRKLSVALILILACALGVTAAANGDGNASTGQDPGDNGAGAAAPTYPECGPYASDTGEVICRFRTFRISQGSCQAWTLRSSDSCPGKAVGAFPWGRQFNGDETITNFNWKQQDDERSLQITSFESGSSPAATLNGVVPNPGSPNFRVNDAFARNDRGGSNGDHFYTPNLPGQAAGTVGGPLYINVTAGGAKVEISGYLYLGSPAVRSR